MSRQLSGANLFHAGRVVRAVMLWAVVVGGCCPLAYGQPEASGAAQALATPGQEMRDAASSTRFRPDYRLGGGDQISIRAFEMDDINAESYRIDGDGYVNLPTLGRVKAGGQTIVEFEQLLVDLLRPYVRQPLVSVTVLQFRSEPVFFIGAFQAPGIYPLQGQRRLVEMLSAIGGLQPNASRRITVTRRAEYGEIPLPNAQESEGRDTSTVEISLGSLTTDVDPAEDILLQPFDVITVERSERVYVTGGVAGTGALELTDHEAISVAKAIALVGGLAPNAKSKKARVLRPVLNTSRRAEIPVNIDEIMAGRASDFPLMANDVLYVPQKKPSVFNTLRWVMPLGVSAAFIVVQILR